MESNPIEKSLENEEIDRISDLPDLILSKILCKLPTKNAVGTSILSSRWKNLFLFGFMPKKLDFDDSLLLNPNMGDNNNSNNTPSVTFIKFVDKLFNVTLSDVESVDEIFLHCDKKYGQHKVASWISAALRLNVQHLDLKVKLKKSKSLFRSLNGCMTLVTLRLWVKSVLKVPNEFSLPNVKTLDLVKLRFDDDDGDQVKRFMEGFPVLEYLSLLRCRFWYDICIKCPLLKKLVIEGYWEQPGPNLTFHAPNLESLICNGSLATRNFVCDFKSLHMAHIGICPGQYLFDWLSIKDTRRYFNDTAMIVACCSSTIRLYLSHCAIDALHCSSIPLPLFPNLTWLSLDHLYWPILAHLLQIAPKLEQLIIKEGFQEYSGGFHRFTSLLRIPPECLVLHVKRIEFREFEGKEEEIKLVEYFLKNGEVLQNLILHYVSPNDVSILRRLHMLPKQSKTCQIECIME